MMRGWFQDLRLAARTLAQRPGYSGLAIATLGLGLAAAITAVAVFDTVLVSPLPYHGSERLLVVTTGQPAKGLEVGGLSAADFYDYHRELDSFEALELWSWNSLVLERDGKSRDLATARVSPGLLPMLGIRPLLGRVFSPEETPASRVVVISHSLWSSELGGVPDVVGRELTLSGEPWTVVGVMPPGFTFPLPSVRMWLPLETAGGLRTQRSYRGLGRLRPGVSLETARAEAETLSLALEREHPASNRDWRARLVPLKELRVGAARQEVWAGLAAAGLLLLIAGVTVSQMLMVRGLSRQNELATRAALGASRFRLWRLLVAESTVLAVSAGALGLLLAAFALALLSANSGEVIPRAAELGLSARAVGAAVVWSFLVGPVLGGLSGLTSRSRPGGAPRSFLTRRLVTVAQLALCWVLLVGTGLFARSLERLVAKDPGFVPEHAVAAELFAFGADAASQPERWRRLGREIEDQAAAIPGLAAVGLVNALPLSPVQGGTISVEIAGRPGPENTRASYRLMTPGALAAMGRRLVAGRFFSPDDHAGAEPVTLVSQETVRRFFAGQDPLGATLRPAGGNEPWARVVGVIADLSNNSLERGPEPEVVFPFDQRPWGQMVLVARATGPRPGLVAELEEAVWRAEPRQGVYRSLELSELVRDATNRRRFLTRTLVGFAVVALTVVALGLAGLIAFSVRRRLPEIAVRLALGADQRRIRWLVMAEASWLVALGLGLGLVLSQLTLHATQALLFDTAPGDPLTLVVASLALTGITLGASLVPASRASRQAPAFLLRQP